MILWLLMHCQYGCLQVRIMSLDPEDVLGVLALQAVQTVPESLLLIDSPAADISAKGAENEGGAGALFLNIGALRLLSSSVSLTVQNLLTCHFINPASSCIYH